MAAPMTMTTLRTPMPTKKRNVDDDTFNDGSQKQKKATKKLLQASNNWNFKDHLKTPTKILRLASSSLEIDSW